MLPVQGSISQKKVNVPIVISLTAIPPRFKTLHLVIKSMLAQSVQPEKIVLWLNQRQRGKLPGSLTRLIGDLFEIRYSHLDCPHLKLVESLRIYPDKIIVTADDDLMYRKKWLENLYAEHQAFPDCIIANQSRVITYDEQGQPKAYKEWPTNYDANIRSSLILPIGSAGALYPPDSLSTTVLDRELFLKLAPKADDLWFKAMSLLRHTPSLQSSRHTGQPIPVWGSQKVNLKKGNIHGDKNREQWLALTQYFKIPLNLD